MNDALVEFLEALESGEYKQARASLRNRGGFCCLGVACDLDPCVEWKFMEDAAPEQERYEVQSGEVCNVGLAVPSAIERLGLPDEMINKQGDNDFSIRVMDPLDLYCNGWRNVDHLNDHGKTFKEIAQMIRDTYNMLEGK